MGLHEQAEQMFYLAQQINPECALCYYNIGNSLFSRGEYKKAILCWMKTFDLEPSHPQINYHIAQALWAEGETERCHQHFLKELRINPGDVDVIIDFGLFLLAKGDVESAKEKFNRALELRPEMAVALFYLGEIAFNSNDHKKATEFYNSAMERDAHLAGPRYRLGQLALLHGNTEDAKTYLASEMKLADGDAEVLVSMASMFLSMMAQTGDKTDDGLDLAANCLLHATDLDPANADAFYYLGLANALNDRLDDACEFFSQALEINPQHLAAIRDSAIVLFEMNRIKEASRIIEDSDKFVGSDNPELKDIRKKIRRAQITHQLAGLFGKH